MTTEVEVIEFKEPSGNVRGLVNAFVPHGGQNRRIAHATLLVDKAPDVLVEVPKRLTLVDIPTVANGLLDFASRLGELETPKEGTDFAARIAAEEALIAGAQARLAKLKQQRGPVMTLIDTSDETRCLLTLEEFNLGEETGMFTSDDGDGVWATATHESDVRTSQPQPDWATHVSWFNR